MSWCRSPWVILFDTLCTFWTFRSVSFAWLISFQSLFLKIGFLILSLSLSSGTSYSEYTWHFASSHINCPHVCCCFFLFPLLFFGWFPLACLPDRWSFLLHHIILCWLPLLFLFLNIILFLSLNWFFSHIFFLSLCLTSHYVLPVFFWVHWVSSWPLIWTFSLGGSLSLFSFSSFSEFLSCSFTWNIFPCLFMLPNSPLCFYVLGISGLSPSLEGVTV